MVGGLSAQRCIEPVVHAGEGEAGGADLAVRAAAFRLRERHQRLAAGQVVVELLRLALEEEIVLGVADQRRAADALGEPVPQVVGERGLQGSQFFRVYVATAPLASQPSEGRTAAVKRRIEQIAAMLERARSRGERAPDVLEVTDHLLAPLYMRALFGVPADASVARGLVARLLTHTPR